MNPPPVVAAVDALWALDGAGSQPAGRGDAEPGRRRGAEPRVQRRHMPTGPEVPGAVAHDAQSRTSISPVGLGVDVVARTCVYLCSGTPLSHSTAP